MKTKEQTEHKLDVLGSILKETLDSRMGYVDKQIKISSIRAKIEMLDWVLNRAEKN